MLLLPLVPIGFMGASASPSTTIYVDPPEITTPPSENFTVNINIHNVIDLFAWQIKLKWNPQILDFADATEGNFLKTGGSTTWEYDVNETEGWIFIRSYYEIDWGTWPLPTVSGNGTLSKITVHGASLGECDVELCHTWLIAATPAPAPGETYGDLNGDSTVNIIDAAIISAAWGTSEGDPRYNPVADVNNDGFVDLLDLTYVIFNWGKVYPGDDASKPVEISHEVSDGHVTIACNITVGVDVTVDPTSDLRLTFSNVTVAGYVTVNKTSTVEAPLLVDLVGQYYDIRVTASYSGNVTVSLAYDDANMTQQQEINLTMMQYTPILGDIVEYGQVNILDLYFIAKCFGTTPASPRWNAAADINGDEKIGILDLYLCAGDFGKTAEWTNITTYVDTGLNIVRGETIHFSIIGIH